MSEQRTEKAIQVHNTMSQLTVTYGILIQDVVEELNQARARVKELQRQAEESAKKIEELQRLNEGLLTSLEKVENWQSLQNRGEHVEAEEKAPSPA